MNVLRETVRVRFQNGDNVEVKEYSADDVKRIGAAGAASADAKADAETDDLPPENDALADGEEIDDLSEEIAALTDDGNAPRPEKPERPASRRAQEGERPRVTGQRRPQQDGKPPAASGRRPQALLPAEGRRRKALRGLPLQRERRQIRRGRKARRSRPEAEQPSPAPPPSQRPAQTAGRNQAAGRRSAEEARIKNANDWALKSAERNVSCPKCSSPP